MLARVRPAPPGYRWPSADGGRRAGLFDAPGGDGGHGVGVGVVPGLVGARLADHPPLVGAEEPIQRLAEGRVGIEGPV